MPTVSRRRAPTCHDERREARRASATRRAQRSPRAAMLLERRAPGRERARKSAPKPISAATSGSPSLAGADDVAPVSSPSTPAAWTAWSRSRRRARASCWRSARLAPAAVLPCALPSPTGTGAGLGARGKVVDACQRAIQKADAKLARRHDGGTPPLRHPGARLPATEAGRPHVPREGPGRVPEAPRRDHAPRGQARDDDRQEVRRSAARERRAAGSGRRGLPIGGRVLRRRSASRASRRPARSSTVSPVTSSAGRGSWSSASCRASTSCSRPGASSSPETRTAPRSRGPRRRREGFSERRSVVLVLVLRRRRSSTPARCGSSPSRRRRCSGSAPRPAA